MQNDIVQMTQQRYGYGLWAAPYWFIGLDRPVRCGGRHC